MLTVAGLVVVGVYAVMLHEHVDLRLVVMAAGAVAWVVAAALWTLGWSSVQLAPMLAAFLVLTIAGERVAGRSRLRPEWRTWGSCWHPSQSSRAKSRFFG